MLKAISIVKAELGQPDSEIEDLLIKKTDTAVDYILSQGHHKSNMILSEFIASGAIPKDKDIDSIGKRNLKNAMDECCKFVRYNDYSDSTPSQKRDINMINKIREMILEKYQLLYYELPNEKEVYKTFESLNSRGLPVSAIDNFKSQLMGIAFAANDPQSIALLNTTWAEIYDVIGMEKIVEDDILTISATLYKAIKDEKTRPKTLSEAVDYFSSVAKKTIASSSVPKELKHHNPSIDTEGYRCLRISSILKAMATEMVNVHKDKTLEALTDVKQARVLLFAIRLSEFTDDEKTSLLHAWENTTFRLFVLHRKDSRSFVGEYTSCANQVIKANPNDSVTDIIKSIKEIGKDYTFDKGIEAIQGSSWYPSYNNDVL